MCWCHQSLMHLFDICLAWNTGCCSPFLKSPLPWLQAFGSAAHSDTPASPCGDADHSWAIAAAGGTRAPSSRCSGQAASTRSDASVTSSASGTSSASASPAASEHFAGWAAEDQLAACWGSAGSSFGGHSGSASQGHSPPPWHQPGFAGLPWPGMEACSLLTVNASRPGSPNNAAGSEYMQYTVRSDSILGAPASSAPAAEGSSAGGCTHLLHAGCLAGPAHACSPTGSPASEPAQCQAAGWAPLRYPPLYGSQGWAPGGFEAAEQQEGEGSQAELEHEPSAPPLPDGESWAGDDGGAESAGPPSAVAGSPGCGGPGVQPSPAAGSASGGSPHSGTVLDPCSAWGAAGTVGAAAAADWRWTSESSEGARLVSGRVSRHVSEETGRYQALLGTLAARRQEVPNPVDASACSSAGQAPYSAQQGLHTAGDRPPSGSAGSEEWPESPLPQVHAASQPLDASSAQPAAASGSPVKAKWSGVQTLLTNLAKSAEGWRERQPAAGLAFWDQPASEEEEGQAAGAPGSSGGESIKRSGMTSHFSGPVVEQPPLPADGACPGGRQLERPPMAQPNSPVGPCPSASPPSPAALLLCCARQWVGGSPGGSSADAGASPPRGLAIKFAPLGKRVPLGGEPLS